MNRKQRRAAAKRGITATDLRQERYDGIRYAVKCYSVAVAMVLHDKLGFGPVRLQRIMGQIQEAFDAISEDYVTIGDMEMALLEECGIRFKDGEIKCESTKTVTI